MASARLTGTNEAISTFGAGAEDYTNIDTWEVNTDVDHSTLDKSEVSISNVSATRFDQDEALSFSSSGATATCRGTNAARTKMWYVVTGGTPTTADTITGGTSTATADIDTIDDLTAGVSAVLECSAGEYDLDVSLSAATNDATYFRIIRPVAGAFHTGVRDTGVRFYNTTDTTTISQSDFNTQVQDLCLRGTYNSTTGRGNVTFQGGSDDAAYVGCIFTNCQNSGSGAMNGAQSNSSAVNRTFFIDCLAENNENIGINLVSIASAVPYAYNCTAVGNGGFGFHFGDNATTTGYNCLASGNVGNDFNDTIDTGSNNASSDATAGGTSPRTDQTFTFVNAAAFDYQLAATDAGAKGFGLDLSGDATYPFDDDLERTLWTVPWDIGAFNAVVAQQGPVTWFSPIVVVHRGGR